MRKKNLLYFNVQNFHQENLNLLRNNFKVYKFDNPLVVPAKLCEFINIIFAPLGYYFSKDYIDRYPNLEIIASNTTGDGHIDVSYSDKKGIKVLTLKNEHLFLKSITPTAEFTWALILSITRNIFPAREHVLKGNWNRFLFGGNKMLSNSILGIVGMGRLGFIVGKQALKYGMQVRYYDPYVNIGFPGLVKVNSIKKLVSISDIVTVHIPHTLKNQNFFNKTIFQEFKVGSYFINTSRGEVVNHNDLLDALKKKIIYGSAIDVFENEFSQNFIKNLNSNKLFKYAKNNSNLIITPHIGGSTEDAWRDTQGFVIKKILSFYQSNNFNEINFIKGVTWALIPARGGSKSIPLKNMVKLNGRYLIDYTFDVAKNTKKISRIFCSSDNNVILNYTKKCGIEQYRRSKKLSSDNIPTVDVIKDFICSMSKKEKFLPEFIVLLEPTSPFVKTSDINKCINFLIKNQNYDSAQTVTEVSSNSHAYNQRYHINDTSHFLFEEERKFSINKQTKPKLFIHGNLRVMKTKSFLINNSIFGTKSYPINISKISAMDVDGKEDLKIAEAILKANLFLKD